MVRSFYCFCFGSSSFFMVEPPLALLLQMVCWILAKTHRFEPYIYFPNYLLAMLEKSKYDKCQPQQYETDGKNNIATIRDRGP